jgi:transposase
MVMDKWAERRLREKFESILPMFNERQLRAYLAAESIYLGPGGISNVARIAEVSRDTIRAGLKELEYPGSLEDAAEKVRKEGGGRKKAQDAQPGLLEALIDLVDPESRGDPMSPLRWTCKSTRNLTDCLKQKGFKVSRQLVSKLLNEQGYSLQSNAKVLEGSSHEDRDEQFKYVNGLIMQFQGKGQPAVSVDAKKKENVGAFKNGGREFQRKGKPEKTKVHDFKDPELGKANPYGVYDIAKNTGWVSVGVDHDTSAFAVESIRRWWNTMGRFDYPEGTELLIVCDGGGSNGSRVRLWKVELCKFAQEAGLKITVCHLPPGTSKWNKIEHCLFSYITMNWRGRPLVSLEVVVSLIGATSTKKD